MQYNLNKQAYIHLNKCTTDFCFHVCVCVCVSVNHLLCLVCVFCCCVYVCVYFETIYIRF